MSLAQLLSQHIEQTMEKFIDLVNQKYGVDKSELCQLWKGNLNTVKATTQSHAQPPNPSSVQQNGNTKYSMDKLQQCTKKELHALCKDNKVKVSGTKTDLVQRLLGVYGLVDQSVEIKKPGKPARLLPNSKPKPKPKSKPQPTQTKVVQKIVQQIPERVIRRNNFGNYEHPETKIVLDPKSKEAIGRQHDDGSILPLSVEDIESCKQYKFAYSIPENLNREGDDDGIDLDDKYKLKGDKEEEDDEETELVVEEDEDDDEEEEIVEEIIEEEVEEED